MKKSIKFIGHSLTAFFLTVSTLVSADDTDIYLTNSTQTYPPYLMLMIDYRPSTFNNLCGSVSACAGSALDEDENTIQDQDADGYPLYDDTGTLSGLAINKLMRTRCEAVSCANKGTGNGAYDESVSTFEAFIAVLEAVIDGDEYDDIYVGLMAPNKDDGGVILRGYYQLGGTISGVSAKEDLLDKLKAIPEARNGSDAHKLQPKETYYELYSYLNGLEVINGKSPSIDNNFTGAADVPGPDTRIIESDGTYASPFDGGDFECSQLFGITMAMNVANQDDSLDDEINAIDGASAANATDNFESFLRFMASDSADLVNNTDLDGEQNMINWIISDSGSSGNTASWADAGGTGDGVIFLDDGVNMEAKLKELFTEVLSVSSTFVAASVPVNVFNRTEILDGFYIALFEAEANERWSGNLKKLRLIDSDSDGIFDDIVDANNQSAFDTTDGRIRDDRLSIWTSAADLPAPNVAEGEIDGKDGRAVERGGAGQIIPGFIAGTASAQNGSGTRQLFTETLGATALDGDGDGLIPFDADTTTAGVLETDLGAADVATAQKLIMWSRGVDVDPSAAVDLTLTAQRDWLLGDAIHSRPIAINYGARTGYSRSNPDIRLFMGSNDGYLRQFRNTNPDADGATESGEEVWGFIPRELMSNIQALATNDGSFDAPNTDGSHPYGMDGEIVTLVIDDDKDGTIESGDKVYIYAGMRRGGRSYYAMDVTDPDAPEFLWKIDNNTTGFSDLGLTFSTPVVTTVRYDGTDKNVLIFAGGYDTKKDDTDADGGRDADSMGNAIYIVDAVTGALIWSAIDGSGTTTDTIFYKSDLDHSIPAKVAPLDSNNNGVTDRLYVGDTSGIVWRVDLPEGSATNHRRDNWEVTKFADVDDAAVEEDRRFFHAAELVQTSDDLGNYDGVILGSGDRASPLETTDDNMLFLFKDRETQSGAPSNTVLDDDDIADVTSCVTGTESGCDSTTGTLSTNSLQYGWKIQVDPGEKNLSKPLLADGKVFFTTYSSPSASDTCAPLEGTGNLYFVNLRDGTTAFKESTVRDVEVGPGIPAPVTALTSDTLLIPNMGADIDGDGTRDKLAPTGGKSHWIYYWRQKGLDQL